MAYIPRSSFVPREVSSAIPAQIKKKHTVQIFSFVGTVLLVCAVLSAIGVYFYKGVLDDELNKVRATLSEISNADDQQKIDEIHLYDKKLSLAQNLLDNHLAPSRIFQELESLTKQTVQFESLEFTYDPGFEAALTVVGATKEFSSVFLQKKEFADENPFSDFVVESVKKSETLDISEESEEIIPEEKVTFEVRGIFKENVLKYRGEDTAVTKAPVPSPKVEQTASTTSTASATTSSSTSQTP